MVENWDEKAWYLSQDRGKCQAFLSTVMKFEISQNARNFVTRWTISFRIRALALSHLPTDLIIWYLHLTTTNLSALTWVIFIFIFLIHSVTLYYGWKSVILILSSLLCLGMPVFSIYLFVVSIYFVCVCVCVCVRERERERERTPACCFLVYVLFMCVCAGSFRVFCIFAGFLCVWIGKPIFCLWNSNKTKLGIHS